MQILFRHTIVTFLSSTFLAGAVCAGTVIIKGSDTLGAKLIPQLVETYRATLDDGGENLAFEIAAEGSTTGVAAILEGSADIGMLSRGLDAKEYRRAEIRGLELEILKVARDGLAVIVNENNPLTELSSQEVEAIFTGDIQNWAALSLFAGDISIYTRSTASGSFGAFQSLALNNRDYSLNSQKMTGNEQIASEVASNPYGIGYVGLAYTRTPGVKALPIDGLMPDESGYTYERELYFLIDKNREMSAEARDFIDFCLNARGQRIVTRINFLPSANTQ
ncbi:MAG: phosphate ABC transporter substrate-binding protein [Opitutales bacterium]